MSQQEAQAELAARWGAPTLMRAAVDEYMQVRDWLPPIIQPARQLVQVLETYWGCRCGRWGPCDICGRKRGSDGVAVGSDGHPVAV